MDAVGLTLGARLTSQPFDVLSERAQVAGGLQFALGRPVCLGEAGAPRVRGCHGLRELLGKQCLHLGASADWTGAAVSDRQRPIRGPDAVSHLVLHYGVLSYVDVHGGKEHTGRATECI
jgi:hypothetical protein